MKSLICACACLLLTHYCLAQQHVYQIRADTVRIYNTCDTAELVLENRTKDTLGFLFNKGQGRTEFRRIKLEKLNGGKLAIVGQDTIDIGSGGADTSSVIQNQTAKDQNASFRINGAGYFNNSYTNSLQGNLIADNYRSGLNIASGSSVNLSLNGANSAGGVFRWLSADNTSINYGADAQELMRLTKGGNLGIGALSPETKLHISVNDPNDEVPASAILIQNVADGGNVGLTFKRINPVGRAMQAQITTVPIGSGPGQGMGLGMSFDQGNQLSPTFFVAPGRAMLNGWMILNDYLNAPQVIVGTSGLIVNGSSSLARKTVTESTALDDTYYTVFVNNNSDVTITLPFSTGGNTSQVFIIKKISNNASKVTITGPAGAGVKIEGADTQELSTYLKYYVLQSDGINWWVIGS